MNVIELNSRRKQTERDSHASSDINTEYTKTCTTKMNCFNVDNQRGKCHGDIC